MIFEFTTAALAEGATPTLPPLAVPVPRSTLLCPHVITIFLPSEAWLCLSSKLQIRASPAESPVLLEPVGLGGLFCVIGETCDLSNLQDIPGQQGTLGLGPG